MRKVSKHVLLATILLLTASSTSVAGDISAQETDLGISGQIEQDLRNLTANLARLDQQLRATDQSPTPTDSTLQMLHEIDVKGWRLHREQWAVQRDHLQFALGQLHRLKTEPATRAVLLEQWRRHEEAFEAAMATLRRKREALEQRHLQLESELVERELR